MKCKFEEFLINYQEDLRRIVGKHLTPSFRTASVRLTVDDVVSTINYQLIKTKQKFFDRFAYNFTETDFGKWAYTYARNSVRWGVCRAAEENKNLVDGSFYTEDGEKALFDIVCEELGEEDKSFEEFDKDAKITLIQNIINKYSHLLSDREKAIFTGLLEGKSELQMSKDLKVTRQAINLSKVSVIQKVRAHYNFSVEDVSNLSSDQLDQHIEGVLDIFNLAETRRLKHLSKTRIPNRHPYKYAIE